MSHSIVSLQADCPTCLSNTFFNGKYRAKYHLSDCNGTRTHNKLVRKRTLCYLASYQLN